MLPRAGVDAGNPQAAHVSLLGAPVARRVLQGALDALAGDADAVACAAAEARGELEDGLLVHSFFSELIFSFFLEIERSEPAADGK